MALASISYTADGVTASWPIVINYLRESHLTVSVAAVVQTDPADYTIVSGNIVFGAPPTSGNTILIQRTTPRELENQLVDPTDGSTIKESDLDTMQRQLLFISQEAYENGGGAGSLSPDYINIRDVGAVGDGLNDDTAAIQTTVTLASALGVPVLFPIPTVAWRVTSAILVLGDNVKLFGSNRDACVIRLGDNLDPGNAVIQVGSGAGIPTSGVTIQDLTIDGRFSTHTVPASTDGYHGVFAQRADGLQLINVRIKDVGTDGIRIGDASVAVESQLPNDLSVRDCIFEDIGHAAVNLYGVNTGIVENPTIRRCGYHGIWLQGSATRPCDSVEVVNAQVDRASPPAKINQAILSGSEDGSLARMEEANLCQILGGTFDDNRAASAAGISGLGSTGCSIKNTTVRLAGGWGIIAPSESGDVMGNTVDRANDSGIVVVADTGIDVLDVKVQGNTILDANEGDVGGLVAGIRVLDFAGSRDLKSLSLLGNSIRDTRGTKRCDFGIWIDGRSWASCDGIVIDGNIATDVLTYSMRVQDNRTPSLITNLRIGTDNIFMVDEWYGTQTLVAGQYTSPSPLAHIDSDLPLRMETVRVDMNGTADVGHLVGNWDDTNQFVVLGSYNAAAALLLTDTSIVQWRIVGSEDAF